MTWRTLAERFDAKPFAGLVQSEWTQGIAIRPAPLTMLGERCLKLDPDIHGQSLVDAA